MTSRCGLCLRQLVPCPRCLHDFCDICYDACPCGWPEEPESPEQKLVWEIELWRRSL